MSVEAEPVTEPNGTSGNGHNGTFHLSLRKVNTFLHIPVPQEYVAKYGFDRGDHVVWQDNSDGYVILTIVKTNDMIKFAQETANKAKAAIAAATAAA
jgi:hypothetical protein